MPKKLANVYDIVGKQFGKLTVVEYLGRFKFKSEKDYVYICECACGTCGIQVKRRLLVRGFKISCGCAYKDAGLRTRKNMVGHKFGRLLVLEPAGTKYSKSGKSRRAMWMCACDCGNNTIVDGRALRSGRTLSCGCFHRDKLSKIMTNDLTGRRFGKLVVINRAGSHVHGHSMNAMWLCKCDCSRVVSTMGMLLQNGDTRSCGCNKQSKYEEYTNRYLCELGLIEDQDYFREYSFSDLIGRGNRPLRFDFYLPNYFGHKIAIECQGKQHYSSVKWYGGDDYLSKLQYHDQLKRDYSAKNRINLIEIPYAYDTYDSIKTLLSDNKFLNYLIQ